jgi:hypothetical protein
MKKGVFIFLSAFLFWTINAQTQGKSYNNLSEFTGVAIGVPADVYVTQSTNQTVRIETSTSNLEKIEVKVKNGDLEIKSSKNNVHFKGRIKIYISMKKINKLVLAGSGSITTQGKVNTDDIALSIAGSGNISSKDLSAEQVKISIAGSGSVNLAGTELANSLKAFVSGSGDVNAAGFTVKKVKTFISGSADCYVHATQELNVSLSGSGNVYYSGNPLIDAKISGSGAVKNVN